MTRSCQTSGTDSIAASPSMSKPRTHENRGSTVTSSTAIGSRPSATRPVIPWPTARLTRPTWRPIEAVRGRERQPRLLAIGEVERADLDLERGRRPVDDRPHELVPVARLRRELGDLVEEGELAKAAFGPRDVRRHAAIIGQAAPRLTDRAANGHKGCADSSQRLANLERMQGLKRSSVVRRLVRLGGASARRRRSESSRPRRSFGPIPRGTDGSGSAVVVVRGSAGGERPPRGRSPCVGSDSSSGSVHVQAAP